MQISSRSSRLLTIMLAWAPAMAVAADGTAADQQPAVADQQPAVAELQAVVVSGIRESVQNAQAAKRNAPTVIEAITSEDLGKFTDNSLADALGRVPGVQIQKSDGPGDADGVSASGDQISIRGLGAQYVQTTFNGRPALSIGVDGGSRAFDFDLIPTEVIGGVTIYKTSSASTLESGMAGEVDVHTLKPLDYHGKRGLFGNNFFGNLTQTAIHAQGYGGWEPRFSGILGGKFADDTIGVYVAGVHSREQRRQDRIFRYDTTSLVNQQNPDGSITSTPNVLVPGQTVFQRDQRTNRRNVISAALEWRPNSQLDVMADFTHNRYTIDTHAPSIFLGFNDSYDYSGQVYAPGGLALRDGSLVGFDSSKIIGPAGEPAGQLADYLESVDQDLYNGGINVAWHTENLKLSADFGRSHLIGKTDFRAAYGNDDAALTAAGLRNGLLYSDPLGSAMPSYTIDSSWGNLALYSNPKYYMQQRLLKADVKSYKLDSEYSFSDSFALRLGTDYIDSTNDYRAVNPKASFGTFPAARNALYDNGTFNIFGLTGIPLTSSPAACQYMSGVCEISNFGVGSFAGPFPTNPNGVAADPLQLTGNSGYLAEKNLGLYTQADFRAHALGLPVSGNVGLRAVRVQESGIGISSVATFLTTAVFDPARPPFNQLVTDSYSYWRYLPSLNLTLKPADNVNLRFGVGRTMSVPEYSQLRPNSNVNIYDSGAVGNATSGNLHLLPTMSWNYDTTAEYYTGYGGALIGSLFYKKVSDFVNTATVFGAAVPGQTQLFTVTKSINSQDGYAYGAELGTNQPFTFLPSPWNGLGVQGNITYVNSKFSSARDVANAPAGNFPGASKFNGSAIGYYEKQGFEARVAYTYRTSFVYLLGAGGTSIISSPQAELDASLSYTLFGHLQIIGTATNLTGASSSLHYELGRTFFGYSTRPRVYSISLRETL